MLTFYCNLYINVLSCYYYMFLICIFIFIIVIIVNLCEGYAHMFFELSINSVFCILYSASFVSFGNPLRHIRQYILTKGPLVLKNSAFYSAFYWLPWSKLLGGRPFDSWGGGYGFFVKKDSSANNGK